MSRSVSDQNVRAAVVTVVDLVLVVADPTIARDKEENI